MDCKTPPGSSVQGVLQARIRSRVPCPPPGDLRGPGIKPVSPAFPVLADGALTLVPPGKLESVVYAKVVFFKLQYLSTDQIIKSV